VGRFKSLVDKVQQKKDEIEARAAKKAAEKAAELALARGKEAALAAVEQAGRSLKSAGASIGEALFGAEPDEEKSAPAPSLTEKAPRRAEQSPVDRAAKRSADEARLQREVDDELAALKRKLAEEKP